MLESQEAFQVELATLPPPPLTPLPVRPSCCDPDVDAGEATAGDADDGVAGRMMSLPSAVSDGDAALAGASSLASNASRRSSRRGSRRARSFRTAGSGVPEETGPGATSLAASGGAAAATGVYVPGVFPEQLDQRQLPPRTLNVPADAWRTLQRLPLQPTRVPEVLAACVQMLRAVLMQEHVPGWVAAELWPHKTATECAPICVDTRHLPTTSTG